MHLHSAVVTAYLLAEKSRGCPLWDQDVEGAWGEKCEAASAAAGARMHGTLGWDTGVSKAQRRALGSSVRGIGWQLS